MQTLWKIDCPWWIIFQVIRQFENLRFGRQLSIFLFPLLLFPAEKFTIQINENRPFLLHFIQTF
jgi:hypothetical protein